jgi:hypothetical protein
MGAIAYTLVRATPHQLIYSYTGDAAGTLAYATMAADASVTGPLKTALAALSGETDSNAKATAALLTGAPFAGAVTASITTNIQSQIVDSTLTTTKAGVGVTAVDNGAGNSPDIVLTPDAASTGHLFITHRWSPTV